VVRHPVKESSDVRPISDGEVVNPAQMIAAGDSGFGVLQLDTKRWEPAGMANLSWGMTHPAAILSSYPWALRRHRGRWNVLFCDGHVVPLRIRNLFGFRLDEVRRLWNKDHEPHPEFAPVLDGLSRAADPHNF